MAEINDNTLKMLEERYFLKNFITGELVEHMPEEMFRRVAKTVSKAEKTKELQQIWEEKFYNAMNNQLFMPNTPVLMNAGTTKCYSACSVSGRIPDSLEGIYNHMWRLAKLTKSGVGCGSDLSDIRPKNEIIKTSGGKSAGVVNWMHLIQTVATTTIQGDKARRAANMVSLRFNHPDIEEFIYSKRDNSDLTAMNISVVITNEEYKKALNKENIWLEWNHKKYKEINAGELLDKIIENAHANGDPGLLFIDNINKDNPFNLHDDNFNEKNKHYMVTSNPCFRGDMKLLTTNGYKTFEELCDKEVDIINKDGNISKSKVWCSGEKDIAEIKFLDRESIFSTPDHIFKTIDGNNCEASHLKGEKLISVFDGIIYEVIDVIPQNKAKVYDFTEPLTHWGVVEDVIVHNCGEQVLEKDELCTLGSINLNKLYDTKTKDINWSLYEDTIKTGIRFLDNVVEVNNYPFPEFKEKMNNNRKIGLGVAGFAEILVKMNIQYDSEKCLKFINKVIGFKKNIENTYNQELGKEKGVFPNWKESIFAKNNIKVRCATISTQAPTGSISSILGNESYGIEPFFMISYIKRVMNTEIIETSSLFKEKLHQLIHDEQKEKDIINQCAKKGTIELNCVPKELKKLFRCANDIPYIWHLKVMTELQKYYDNAISKTINLPENATIEDVKKCYTMAYEYGLKGITIYRNNSLKGQTIQIGEQNNEEVIYDTIMPISRSTIGKTYGCTVDKRSACGKMYITINRNKQGNIVESFINVGKNGICKSNIDGVNRLVSLALRSGIKVEEIIDQLKAIQCPACTKVRALGKQKIDGISCPDVLARVLESEYKNGKIIIQDESKQETKEKLTNKDKEFIEKNGEVAFALKFNKCPSCGETLNHIDGCISCLNCAWSKCS